MTCYQSGALASSHTTRPGLLLESTGSGQLEEGSAMHVHDKVIHVCPPLIAAHIVRDPQTSVWTLKQN